MRRNGHQLSAATVSRKYAPDLKGLRRGDQSFRFCGHSASLHFRNQELFKRLFRKAALCRKVLVADSVLGQAFTLAQVPFVLICADCELWRQRILSVRKIARHLEPTSFYNHYQMRSIRFSNWSAHKLHDMLTGFAFAIAFTQNLSTICMSDKNLKDKKRQKRENRV